MHARTQTKTCTRTHAHAQTHTHTTFSTCDSPNAVPVCWFPNLHDWCHTGTVQYSTVQYVCCTHSVAYGITCWYNFIFTSCLNYLITQDQHRCTIWNASSVAMYVTKHKTRLFLLQPAGGQMHSSNCPECANSWHFLTAVRSSCSVRISLWTVRVSDQ